MVSLPKLVLSGVPVGKNLPISGIIPMLRTAFLLRSTHAVNNSGAVLPLVIPFQNNEVWDRPCDAAYWKKA